MYMISKKDLNSAQLETVTTSRSGEVQTHEEAIVYVKNLDIFLIESPRGYASSFIAMKALR